MTLSALDLESIASLCEKYDVKNELTPHGLRLSYERTVSGDRLTSTRYVAYDALEQSHSSAGRLVRVKCEEMRVDCGASPTP